MRPVLAIVFSVVISCCALAQSEVTSEQQAAEAVQRIMSRAHEGMYTSWDAKELARLGDQAAVALTRVIADRDLDTSEIKQALLVINLSFSAPRLVESEPNRHPRTAFFVLKYLGCLMYRNRG
jgi:hypothetical protein